MGTRTSVQSVMAIYPVVVEGFQTRVQAGLVKAFSSVTALLHVKVG